MHETWIYYPSLRSIINVGCYHGNRDVILMKSIKCCFNVILYVGLRSASILNEIGIIRKLSYGEYFYQSNFTIYGFSEFITNYYRFEPFLLKCYVLSQCFSKKIQTCSKH